jgi:hypothetical protein
VLARERQTQWVHYLSSFLVRATRQKKEPTQTFWNSMICNTYLVAQRDPERRQELREQLGHLAHVYRGSTVADGLKQMLEAAES